MNEGVSLEGPVEIVDGELAILIPLDAGGAVLAPLATGIGEIDGDFLKVVIQPWLAEKLRIGAGSLVIVDNVNGKFTITRSAKNDEPPSRLRPVAKVRYSLKEDAVDPVTRSHRSRHCVDEGVRVGNWGTVYLGG